MTQPIPLWLSQVICMSVRRSIVQMIEPFCNRMRCLLFPGWVKNCERFAGQDAATGQSIAELKGHTFDVNSTSFSPDGSKIVSASSDLTMRLWDAATGQSIAELKGDTDGVNSASFSPDGSKIVSASGNRTLRLYDVSAACHLLVTGSRVNVDGGHGQFCAACSVYGECVVSRCTLSWWTYPLQWSSDAPLFFIDCLCDAESPSPLPAQCLHT